MDLDSVISEVYDILPERELARMIVNVVVKNIESVNGVQLDNIETVRDNIQYAIILGSNTVLYSHNGIKWHNECNWDLRAFDMVITSCYNQLLIGKKLQLIDKSEYDSLKYVMKFRH